MTISTIEKYRGVTVEHDSESGFFAEAGLGGIADCIGYCDTIEEVRAEIDAEFDEEAGRPENRRDDTPSLAAPWWWNR